MKYHHSDTTETSCFLGIFIDEVINDLHFIEMSIKTFFDLGTLTFVLKAIHNTDA